MTPTISLAALAALLCCAAWAQPPAGTPTFEAASVKPADLPEAIPNTIESWARGGPGSDDPTRIDYHHVSMNALLVRAFGVGSGQLSAPGWIRTELYDIQAKIAPGATKEQFNLMLQDLLVQRFKLQFHRETKEMTSYSLTAARSGPRLRPHVETAPVADEGGPASGDSGPIRTDAAGFPVVQGPSGGASVGPKTSVRWDNMSTARVAAALSNFLRAPVRDSTGLAGQYDIDLHWVQTDDSVRPAEDISGPDIFAAVEEQLGLKLEKKKGPVEILIVDHLEKVPAGN